MTLMNSLFRVHLDKFELVFIDDILIYSKSMEEHKQHLKQIFDNLRENQLYIKQRKYALFTSYVEFFGHVFYD